MPGGGFDGEGLAIKSRFDTLWTAGPYVAVPVAYPDVPFDEPTEGSTFVKLFVLPGGEPTDPAISTQTPVDFIGIIQVSILTPLANGTKLGREIANWIARNVFDRVEFSAGNSGTITTRRSGITSSRASANHPRYHEIDLDTVYRRRVLS